MATLAFFPWFQLAEPLRTNGRVIRSRRATEPTAAKDHEGLRGDGAWSDS